MTDLEPAVFRSIPDGFLDCPPERLFEILPGPSLVDLPGREGHPLFLSVLLHGNEHSGLEAVQNILRRHSTRELHRPLLLFVGNIAAAAANVRTLPHQADHNRVWPGTLLSDRPEARLARQVFDYAAARRLFASVDIHNNTGVNPHYACINRLEPRFIALARLFSRTIVHFERPLGVQASAFARLCPAVTVECGKTGDGASVEHAIELIESCLSIAQLPSHEVEPSDLDLLRTFAIVRPPADAGMSFDGSPADFRFRPDLDHLNFSELAAGECFGRIGENDRRLIVLPGDGLSSAADYFDYRDGSIRLTQSAIPAMLTQDVDAIRQDCLCYLMHRIGRDGRRL